MPKLKAGTRKTSFLIACWVALHNKVAFVNIGQLELTMKMTSNLNVEINMN